MSSGFGVVVAVLGFGEREAGLDLQGLPDCVASVRGFFGPAAGPGALHRGAYAGGDPADRRHTYPEVPIRVRLL
jgi:hypothetical protein